VAAGEPAPIAAVQVHTPKGGVGSDVPKPANGGGSSLKSLDALAERFAREKAEKKAQTNNVEEDVARSYALNTGIVLDAEKLATALKKVGEDWKQANKFTLGSILINAGLRIQHNKVVIAVTSEVEQGMLEKDRSDLLGRLREVSGYADIFLELEVDAALSAQQDMRPYTLEEKLKAMSQANPALRKLQEIFKTRIVQ